jgi:hypothetical protein
MTENREGAIPPELFSTLVLATGSFYNASRALPETLNAYFEMPVIQRTPTLQMLMNTVKPLVENRATVDLYFRARFKRKIFEATVDDGRAVLDMSMPCTNERDFVSKMQALAGFVTRFNDKVKDLITDQRVRARTRGSINILETILNEKFRTYDPEIISSLRKINTLRSQMYPTHTTTPEAIQIFEQIGYQYPPNNWNQVWEALLRLCNRSLRKLVDLLRGP